MKNLFAPLSRKIALAAGVALAVVVGTYVFATGTVTPATGGANISIDTTSASGGSGTYVVLTGGPVITENTVGDISAGIHTLTLPSGWEFDTAQNVTIGIGGATELTLGAQVITPSTNSLSFNVTAVSSTGPAILTFNNLKVRPTTTTPSSGSITHTVGTIVGVTNGSTNFATLSTVAGSATQLAFTTQPSATTVYGSSFATSPVVKTKDQFGNDTTAGIGTSKIVTLALTGTGNATGTLSLDIGSSSGNGTVTFGGITIDDIGTGNFFTASASGVTSTTSATFSITAKALTATSTVATKVYDGATSTSVLAASLVGVVGSDVVTVSTTSASASFVTASAGNGKSANVSGLVLGGTHASKYTFDGTATGTGDITPLGVTVTASSTQSKVYGDTDPTFDYTLSTPLIPGNTITGALARVTGQSVGTYAINQGTLSAGSNYSITFVSNNFSITARPITVTAVTNSKVYDRTTTAAAIPIITSGTLATGDTANFIETYDDKTATTSKTLTPSGTVTSSNPGTNYSITFVATTTGVITKKALTVVSGLSVTPKNYDGNTSATVTGGAGVVGVIAGDSVSPTIALGGEVYASSTAGTHNVTGTSFTISGADAGNYSATPIVLTGVINPKPITVTPNASQTKVYGTTDPTYTYTNTALVGGDTLSGSLSRVAGENVGSYAITLGTVTANANYAVTLDPTTVNFSITTKPITVTASSTQSKIYGGVDPVFGYSVSPALISGDSFTGSLSRVAGETVGTYAIATGTLSAGPNYAISFVSNNFTINKATPVITWAAPADIVYGTLLSPTQLNASASVSGAFLYTPASSTLLNAGNGQTLSVAFTPSDTTNYNGATATTSINVAKATPVITWATPSAIAAGTALSGAQLNATASVPGAFVYTPASGYTGFTTVGTQTLSTNFTPTDTANYNSVASTTVSLTIVPAAIAQFSLATTTTDVTVPSVVTVTGKDAYGNIVTNDSSTVVSFTPVNANSISDFFKTLVAGVTSTSLTKSVAGYAQINAYVNGNGAVTPKSSSLTFTDASDHTAPVISSVATNKASYEATNDTNITVTVVEDNTANSVTVNGNTATETTPTSGIWTVTFVKSTSIGTQSLIVSATDISGNTSTVNSSYNVVANAVPVVTPTVTLVGAAITSAYSQTAANSRFASGVQFTTTNATSVTVNGISVTASTTITADTFANATTLGVHTYTVVVTSSTGTTATVVVSYQVNPDSVTPVIPTVTLNGAAASSSYTLAQAQARFATGVVFTTTNASSVTVNGSLVTASTSVIGDTLSGATTLGVHAYNVIVTSATGHTANITVSYQVTTNPVVQGNGTLGVTGISTVNSTMTADNTFTNGGSWTFYVTVPTTETNLSLKFGDWVSGSNSIATAGNMRIYSAQSSNATASTSAIAISAANTYSTALTLTGDLDPLTAGRQVAVTVDLRVPVTTAGGSFSTNYGVLSN